MTQSDSDTNIDEQSLPGDWSLQFDDDENTRRRWQSDDLGMAVEITEIDEYEMLAVEALQSVETMGYASTVTTHLEMLDVEDEADDRAMSFMEDAVDGQHSVEPLCAFESEETVDFVCVYTDDLDDVDDLEALRQIVLRQLGSADGTGEGVEAIDADLSAVEFDPTTMTFDVFPKTKPNVEFVGGDES